MPRYLLRGPERKKLLLALLEPLGVRARGFLQEPIHEEDELVGYTLRSLGGRQAWIAHISDAGPVRIGRFRVNVPEIDFVGTESLKGEILPDRVFVIDEINRILLASRRLQIAIKDAFASGASVLATVEDRPPELVETLRKLPGVEAAHVTAETFDEQRERISASLRPRAG
jgi:nucleoside-triphosphatase THEP1